jgi:hypothetical protein
MSEMITPYKYTSLAPSKTDQMLQKMWQTVKQIWWAYAFLLGTLGAVGFMHHNNDPTGVYVAYALFGLTFAMCTFGSYVYYKRASFGYTLWKGRIQVKFFSDKYYVPPAKLDALLTEVQRPFLEHLTKPEAFTGAFVIQDQRPLDPEERQDPDKIIGITSDLFDVSYVYGPYALYDGGLGYEFRLQLCDRIMPRTTEAQRLAWMESEDIYP